jgi:hypothetical protein
VIISGVILAVLGYMSGLTVLQAIGGILIVVMWGNSSLFFPSAMPGLQLAGADIDVRPQVRAAPVGRPLSALRRRLTAHRVAAMAVAAARPAEVVRPAEAPVVEPDQAVARLEEVAGTTVASDLSRAAAHLCSPART